MNLQLINTKATNISLYRENESNEKTKQGFRFKVGNAFAETEDESKSFLVLFELDLNLENSMRLEVHFEAEFELDTYIDLEFRESKFPTINAPAIAYPYARAFISNLLLNAGYEPILLPSVNFVALHNDSK